MLIMILWSCFNVHINVSNIKTHVHMWCINLERSYHRRDREEDQYRGEKYNQRSDKKRRETEAFNAFDCGCTVFLLPVWSSEKPTGTMKVCSRCQNPFPTSLYWTNHVDWCLHGFTATLNNCRLTAGSLIPQRKTSNKTKAVQTLSWRCC